MDEVISTLWAAFFGSWALAGRQGRPAEYSEASGTFLARVALFGLAFALVMSDYCRIRVVPVPHQNDGACCLGHLRLLR